MRSKALVKVSNAAPENVGLWGSGPIQPSAGEAYSKVLVEARHARERVRAQTYPPGHVEAFREALKRLENLPLAALLRELGMALYNRDIARWGVLVDISDELIDQTMVAARERITEKWLAKPCGKRQPRKEG